MATATRKRRSVSDSERIDVYQLVTDRIVGIMESGTVPWRKPWKDSQRAFGLPLSLSTRKPYRGINVLLLSVTAMERGYSSPWWATYEKITERGGQVRKGEKSTMVTFWKQTQRETENEKGELVKVPSFFLRYYRVFNAEQADWPNGNAPAYEVDTRPEAERIESAESIIAGYVDGPTISRDSVTGAWYMPARDHVAIPAPESFPEHSEFYNVMFHELTHSTGHSSRLSRTFGESFGTDLYSKEELVAELGSAILADIAGIGTDRTEQNSAAYLAHWIGRLHDDKKLIVHAAAQAQRAADRILGTEYGTDPE